MSLQRYYLESVGFEYQSQGETTKRCVQWRDLVDKNPIVQMEDGKPYVILELEARVEGNCPLKFANGQALNFVADKGAIKVFRFKVSPPSVAYSISGPGFSDQLIFEALVSQPEEVGFFKFLENSQTRFSVGYGTFKTNHDIGDDALSTSKIFPIMAGQITVPFPWYSRLHLGFSLAQNLSNFVGNKDVQLQFSEFAFDLRFLLRDLFGRQDFLALVSEVRGRNWYQLGEEKPFVVRSSPGFGFGIDYDTWFGSSRWGMNMSSRYGIRGATDAKLSGELRAGVSANYKLSKKWALGLGYKWSRLGIDFTGTDQSAFGKVVEQSNIVDVSLILIPNRGESR